METEQRWVKRWNIWTAAKPSRPGVWRRKEGGYFVRAKVMDPRTGRRREHCRVLGEVKDAAEAQRWLLAEVARIKAGQVEEQSKEPTRFKDYAVSLIERKHLVGEIASAKTILCLESMFKKHLFPAFGDFFVDRISKTDVEAWKMKMAATEYSPTTINNTLRVLKTIMTEAVEEFGLPKNPLISVKPLDTSMVQTYTEEEPNALTIEEVPVFLRLMRQRQPEHFAMTALGFATGLRPSSLRPLRRKGPTPDVLWDEGVLLVRRSHTVKDTVMEKTKQGTRYRITLPKELMEILEWHVAQLATGFRSESLPPSKKVSHRAQRMVESDLLFPSRTGGFRTDTVLQKPFADVMEAMKLKKHLSPRAMRRTFQDLARGAAVEGLVQRSICGHATGEMTERYSSVAQDEIKTAVGKVISLARFRDAVGAVGGQVGGQSRKEGETGEFATSKVAK